MQAYIWVLWDIAAILLLAYCIHSSAARGLVRTIVSLMGYVVAAFVADIASPVAARWLYEHVARDTMRMVLLNRLQALLEEGGAAAGELMDAVPEGLRRIMGGELPEAAGAVSGSEAAQLVEGFIEAALRDPVLSILQGGAFLVIFTLTLLVMQRVSRMFTGIYRIPVIGTVNTLLGGVVGVLQALLVLFIAAMVVRFAILLTGGYVWMSDQVMDDSYVWRVFYNLISF